MTRNGDVPRGRGRRAGEQGMCATVVLKGGRVTGIPQGMW